MLFVLDVIIAGPLIHLKCGFSSWISARTFSNSLVTGIS
jgi:hypothetical protein